MTENNYDKLKDAICELVNIAEDATSREVFEILDNAGVDVIDCLDKLSGYEAIGTIEEFKALKEKSVAKKPHSISIANDIGNSMVECPICHARSDYDVKSIKRGYCWKCGQKLDWSE